ncbi:hypothetical protein COY95_02085, partial [Candidatus Woesearchaeota archaeon CG_4_10_14_0_8_um_filter_47_5]
VIFVCGLSFAGYILMRWLGEKKGLALTGLLGGLVSSTPVMTTMAAKAKEYGEKVAQEPFVFAAVIASSTMFLRIVVEVFVINPVLVPKIIIPMLIMALTGGIGALVIFTRKNTQQDVDTEVIYKSPFTLGPAVKFGLFFAFVLFFSKFTQMHFGSKGLYATSLISGLADVDAITISVSKMAGSEISGQVAVTAITIAACTNTIVKGGIAWLFGSRKFARQVALIFALMLLAGFLSLLLV